MTTGNETSRETGELSGDGLTLLRIAPPSYDPMLQSMPRQRHDLQNLPEDPVVRPMLIINGVPRHLWPDSVISSQQATELIRKYGV
jgi:hypothetical protein